MSNEVNDKIKDDLVSKISDMTLKEKLDYLFDFATNNPHVYDEEDLDELLSEIMWEEELKRG